MKNLLFFEKQNSLKQSGIGRAMTHQMKALELNNVDITIYVSNNLNINRLYKSIDLKEKLKIKKSEDLVLEGIGFITFNKDTEIKYEKYVDFNIYTRKSL